MADQLKPIQWGALPEVANASPAMQIVDDPDLGTIQVPAGMDPGAFAAATAGARAEAQRKRQMQANMGTLGQIVAPLMEGPTQVYPQAAPVAAMAMGPNYQSFRQGQQQQIAAVAARKAEQERNALVEKQELARLQEQEKDRRQRLQVEMMRMKNDKDESAIRQQFERSKMEQERMMADASREDSERDRLAKEQLTRDQMASREKMAGMRAASRGGGGGGGGGDGVDGKRAAAHQKYLQDRYKEYRDRGEMESDEAWQAAETDAKRFYPEYYPEQAPKVRTVTRSAWNAAQEKGNDAVKAGLAQAKKEGRIRIVDDPETGGSAPGQAPAQAPAAPPAPAESFKPNTVMVTDPSAQGTFTVDPSLAGTTNNGIDWSMIPVSVQRRASKAGLVAAKMDGVIGFATPDKKTFFTVEELINMGDPDAKTGK